MVEGFTEEGTNFAGILSAKDVAQFRRKVFNLPEPKAIGAAEPAALAFIGEHDAQPIEVGGNLTLVSNETRADTPSDEAKAQKANLTSVRDEIATKLRSLIASTNGSAKAELEHILDRLLHNHGDDLDEAIRDAMSAIGSGGVGGDAPDSPEERKELLNNIQQLTDDVKTISDKYWNQFTEEEKKRILEAEKKKREDEERLKYLEEHGGTAEQIKAAQAAVAQDDVAVTSARNAAMQRLSKEQPDNPELKADAETVDVDTKKVRDQTNILENLGNGAPAPNRKAQQVTPAPNSTLALETSMDTSVQFNSGDGPSGNIRSNLVQTNETSLPKLNGVSLASLQPPVVPAALPAAPKSNVVSPGDFG